MSDDLNRELAEAMGWAFVSVQELGCEHDAVRIFFDHWHDGEGLPATWLPDFTTSLDALRDGPEKVLREAGCYRDEKIGAPYLDGKQRVTWFDARGNALTELDGLYNGDEAEARARAALAALRALKVEASNG